MRILRLEARPLSIPLTEPFVIATGRMDTTRGAVVIARIIDESSGRPSRGLGEAAALPPVTRVDQPELLAHLRNAGAVLAGQSFTGHSSLQALLDDAIGHDPVARAGVEAALLDAWARLEEVPAHTILGSEPAPALSLVTDITIPIAPPEHMAE